MRKRIKSGRLLLAAIVVAPLVAAGLGMGPVASAATPPRLSVALSGATDWTFDWDGTPAVDCVLYFDGFPSPVLAAAGSLTGGFPGAGPHQTFVECPAFSGETSPTITVYAPRNAENDMRTQFSNATQGAFGS